MFEDVSSSAQLGQRLREIRTDLYGDDVSGLEAVANALSLPEKTWVNFERGVTMPAPLLLQFLVITEVNPSWLMNGSGPRFLGRPVVSSGS